MKPLTIYPVFVFLWFFQEIKEIEDIDDTTDCNEEQTRKVM